MAHGIHPAILVQGGLPPALRKLARRSHVPVILDVSVHGRLPAVVFDHQPVHPQHHVAWLSGTLAHLQQHRASDHERSELRFGGGARVCGAGHPSKPEHGYPVGDGEHFL